MNPKRLFATAAAAVLFVAAGAANAGERIKLSAIEACSTIMAEELQLDEGHSVVMFRNNCVDFEDDPTAFGHLATGDCVGIMEIRPDESYSVSGFCTYTYRDGSKEFEKIWETSEMEEGRFEIIGGTGKLAGASGGGTYAREELTDTLSYYEVKGVIELP